MFQKPWVLQPIAYGRGCLIQIDSGKGLFNTWTALSCAQQGFFLCQDIECRGVSALSMESRVPAPLSPLTDDQHI